jgi:hypothetical protein
MQKSQTVMHQVIQLSGLKNHDMGVFLYEICLAQNTWHLFGGTPNIP